MSARAHAFFARFADRMGMGLGSCGYFEERRIAKTRLETFMSTPYATTALGFSRDFALHTPRQLVESDEWSARSFVAWTKARSYPNGGLATLQDWLHRAEELVEEFKALIECYKHLQAEGRSARPAFPRVRPPDACDCGYARAFATSQAFADRRTR